MPAGVLLASPRTGAVDAAAPAGPSGGRADSAEQKQARPPAQLRVGQTIVGLPPNALGKLAEAQRPAGALVVPAKPHAGTLLGVARPGIAPLAPGGLDEVPPAVRREDLESQPVNYEPAHELGATMGPAALRRPPAPLDPALEKQRKRIIAPPAPRNGVAKAARPARKAERGSRRALALVFAAGALAFAAVLVAVFWPSPPPLQARARADASGREGVELTCKTCPDGTKLSIGSASATTTAGQALIPLPAALAVGENRFKVAIDRPGNGRDETVSVNVNVAYRIRPDLATLQAERPAFQILAEVAGKTTVTIDGRPMVLSAGHGVANIDVTDDCTGLAADVKTLSRQVPYVVTPESGPPEQGVVNIAVGVVPLRLESPVAIASVLPHVITDGPSFVLAGSTIKGAEVFAAGRPITVHPDGTFAQVMNVSSVGATQIEVRAKMAGMAPRLTQIKVRRVESLEKAMRELLASDPPIPFAQLVANIAGSVGKAVSFTGEVSETKKQGYETVMLVDVSSASGCVGAMPCTVRLVQGADNAAKRGDSLRVFGHVARPFSLPGRADIPEIEVDFTLKPDGSGKDRR